MRVKQERDKKKEPGAGWQVFPVKNTSEMKRNRSDCFRDGFGLPIRNPGSQSEGTRLSFRKMSAFSSLIKNIFLYWRYFNP